jgi:spermidine/putrescine transport system substrate-binding protein
MLRKNLLQPINKEFPAGTPNWLGNVSPFAVDKFQQMATKPGMDVSDYAVGFMWGTTGILYNTRLVKPEEVESWDALYNPRFQERILMKDAFRDIYSVMVCYANYQDILDGKVVRDSLVANITYDNIDKVEKALVRAKKQISGWEVDFGKERMTQGKAWINVTWSGDAMWAIEETAEMGIELDYIVPKEGSNCWFDGWVIPIYAKNTKAAAYWINFMCNSENAVRNMNEIGYVSVIGTEEVMNAMTDDEIEEAYDLSYFFPGIEGADSLHINPVMYPDRAVIERCALMHDCAEKNEAMLVMWSRVKGNSLKLWMVIFIITVFAVIISAIVLHYIEKWRKRKMRRLRLKEFTKKMHDKGRHI